MPLFKYSKSTRKIKDCEITTFSENMIMELNDMEEWVLTNRKLLLEELLPVTKEYDGFDKTNERLDILAIDKAEKLVVIELKRDDSGKNVALQAIKYAAYCSTLTFQDVVQLRKNYLSRSGIDITSEEIEDEIRNFVENRDFSTFDYAPRIILVAKEFRPEVTHTVYWLITQFGMDISCITLTPYIIDDHNLGIVSQIVLPIPEAKDFLMNHGKKEQERQVTSAKMVNWTLEKLNVELEQIPNNLLRDRLKTIMDLANQKEKIRLDRKAKPQFRILSSIGGIIFTFYFDGQIAGQLGFKSKDYFINEDSMNAVISELKRSALLKDDFDKDKQMWSKNLEMNLESMDDSQFNSLIALIEMI